MPRLTLRTLLAYIDDTLDPAETQSLGKKVAESDEVRQLVERIKKVTRRRGLQTPVSADATDETADPNTVAAYLDNTLDSDTLKQLEETCLASDVHLAEVAACHQILTLVLTEPVRVPPRAHKRMYELMPAPASAAGRRPNSTLPIGGAVPPTTGEVERDDADAALLLGMKRYLAAPTLAARLSIVFAAALLLLLLSVAAWNVLPRQAPQSPAVSPGNSYAVLTPSPAAAAPVIPPSKDKVPGPVPVPAVVSNPAVALGAIAIVDLLAKGPVAPPVEATNEVAAAAAALTDLLAKAPVGPGLDAKVEPPKLDIVPNIARLLKPSSPVLVVKKPAKGGDWKPLKTDGTDEVDANDTIMALPGYKPDLLVNRRVEVHLWGNVPEQLPLRVFESRVQFHEPPTGFDADITLLGGRIYLKSKKKGAGDEALGVKVRLRVGKEVWDVTIPDWKTDVLVELIAWFEPGTAYARKGGTAPKLEGRVAVSFGSPVAFAAPNRPAKFVIAVGEQVTWNSFNGELNKPSKVEPEQAKNFLLVRTPIVDDELGKNVQALLSGTAAKRDGSTSVQALLTSRLTGDERDQLLTARLAIYAMAAVADGPDAVRIFKQLVDELKKEVEPGVFLKRQAIITALIHWVARDAGNTARLHEILMGRGLSEDEADVFLEMLRCFVSPVKPKPDRLNTLLDRLANKDMSIMMREAALWNLCVVAAGVFVPPAPVSDKAWHDGAAVGSKEYDKFVSEWKKRIDMRKKP